MQLSDYSFDLPPERIAQEPTEPRDQARLMVHRVAGNATSHQRVSELPGLLREGDLLVMNNTRVLASRLRARRASGGMVELLLLEAVDPADPQSPWRAMVRPARKPKAGELAEVLGGVAGLRVEFLERELEPDGQPGALWRLRLRPEGDAAVPVEELLEQAGEMPLPPYIQRPAGGKADDRERYQTVYATQPGAVAAPTAGLHFTTELLAGLQEAGIRSAEVTLHVGLGTFLPVQVQNLDEHRMHSERFEVGLDCAAEVQACRERGGRVVAVGTTSVRALESSLNESGQVVAGSGSTELFVRPGYVMRAVDGLLTNFHLPGSTLLMLVSALTGRQRLLELYSEAIAAEYRFYSYGDAMLLLP